MFATYWLNIRRLLTQSIRRRPNLHVKNEHRRIIAEYSLAVRENSLRQRIFFHEGCFVGQLFYLFVVGPYVLFYKTVGPVCFRSY